MDSLVVAMPVSNPWNRVREIQPPEVSCADLGTYKKKRPNRCEQGNSESVKVRHGEVDTAPKRLIKQLLVELIP